MDQRTGSNPFHGTRPEKDGAGGLKRWTRRVPGGMRTVVVGVAILLVVLLVWAIKPSVAPAPNRFGGANQAMPVGVATVSMGDIDVTLNALGTVTPLATVTVKPQVGGQLVKINFTEGQMVQKDQILAQIDPKPYQAALDQARGQLARDQASLANAEVDLKRYRMLITENSISQQQVDTQAALVLQDQGVVKSDQANVESAQINLDYTTIRSPILGRAGLRQVDLGNLVTAGQATGIVVVTELDPISVVFAVPEDNIDQIMGRIHQGAMLSADAYDRAQTKKIASGTLATVDNQIDPTTGTVKLRAMYDNKADDLFPNQFVNIRLLIDTLHNQIVVPVAAVQRGSQGAFAYVVNPDHTVSMRTITLGATADDRVAVAKGLKAGDMVVVDGADRLRDGAKVLLPGEKAPAAGTVPAAARNGNRAGRRGGRRAQGNAAAPAATAPAVTNPPVTNPGVPPATPPKTGGQ